MMKKAGQEACAATRPARMQVRGPGFEAEILLDSTNRRLKTVSYQGVNLHGLAQTLKELARDKGLGKVIFLAGEDGAPDLEQAGFIREGQIPGFFRGETALCYSFFVEDQRACSPYWEEEDRILREISSGQPDEIQTVLPPAYELRPVMPQEVDRLVGLYRQVFASYPSPLFDPEYVRQVMEETVYFLAVFVNHQPVSAGSAEMDQDNLNAEITDLATHREQRGLGLATAVMAALEKEMWARGLKCLYSLARAGVPGVNRGFFKLGYTYHGRLLNNCHIGGRYEDMNIWVKLPQDHPH